MCSIKHHKSNLAVQCGLVLVHEDMACAYVISIVITPSERTNWNSIMIIIVRSKQGAACDLSQSVHY